MYYISILPSDRIDNTNPPVPYYNGQLKLCPSDDQISNDDASKTITSTSQGVVSLHINGIWRGINQPAQSSGTGAPLGGTEADAICRQMGFTQAVSGSALSKDASGYTFHDC